MDFLPLFEFLPQSEVLIVDAIINFFVNTFMIAVSLFAKVYILLNTIM